MAIGDYSSWLGGRPLPSLTKNGDYAYWNGGRPLRGLDDASGPQELDPAGIASGEAFGTPTVSNQLQLLDPAGIASAEAFGTPKVAGPIIATGIPSAEAFGTLAIRNQNQFVAPGGIASAEAFGNPIAAGPISPVGIPTATAFGVPVVAGPISPAGIASEEAFGTLRANVNQTISPAGIPSEEAFGTPAARHVQTIAPAGIESEEAFGTPVVRGGQQFIYVAAGIAAPDMGVPTLTGGAQVLDVFIGGRRRTNYLKPATVSVQSQTIGRWSASMQLYDNTGQYAPARGQTVLVQDKGRRLFYGIVTDVTLTRDLGTARSLTMDVTCRDLTSIFDRRLVLTDYTADQDAADVARDILANSMDGEGITALGIPESLGPLGSDLPQNLQTAAQTFDKIADLIGGTWWTDVYGNAFLTPLTDLPAAPIALTETSKNYMDHKALFTLDNYATEVFVRSNLTITPDDPTGSSGPQGVARVDTFTLPQQSAQDRGFLFGALILPFPAVALTLIKVNGEEKTSFTATGASYGTAPADLSLLWWIYGGSPYLNCPTAGPDSVFNPGDVVEVHYLALASNATVDAGDPIAPAPPSGLGPGDGYGTAGSGRFQVVKQVNDISKQSDIDAIAAAWRAKLSVLPDSVQFSTDEPGLMVGQSLPVDWPNLYLPARTMIITGLTAKAAPVDLGRGSTFRWQVTASTADQGNSIKFFERLIARTEHPLPIDRIEEAEFIIAPGSSIAAGAVDSNWPPVANTGTLFEAIVTVASPSTDQDLILDVTDVGGIGGSIFGPNGLSVPSGAQGPLTFTSFYAPVPTIFRLDVLKPSVSYRVTGADPQPAGSITLRVRWKY